MGAAFLLFGIPTLLIGLLICHVHHIEVTESESYTGKVVGMLEKTRVRRYIVYHVYCPVVSYKKDGRTVTAEHHSYEQSVNIRHHVGETVIICANPKMPKSFYFADEETRVSLGGLTVAISGGLVTMTGLIALILA